MREEEKGRREGYHHPFEFPQRINVVGRHLLFGGPASIPPYCRNGTPLSLLERHFPTLSGQVGLDGANLTPYPHPQY